MTHKLLVVDDAPDLVLLCRINLERAGYEVLSAGDGREALTAIRAKHPDLVLLDLMMPEVDGWEVLAVLRADPLTKDLPVVLLTAKAHDSDQLAAWQAGATDYIVKPFTPESLVAAVRDALDPTRGTPAGQEAPDARSRPRPERRGRLPARIGR